MINSKCAVCAERGFPRKDGSLLNGSISARIVAIQKVPHIIISVVHNITQSKQAEETVRDSASLSRLMLNASPDSITITNLKGDILVIFPAAKKIFAYKPNYDQLEEYHQTLDETGKSYLNRIRSASRQMWQVTDGLLALLIQPGLSPPRQCPSESGSSLLQSRPGHRHHPD